MAAMNVPVWRQSKRCDSGACVQVATTADEVLVRDGKDTTGPHIAVSNDQWRLFVRSIQEGKT